jgi:hypothetical protein
MEGADLPRSAPMQVGARGSRTRARTNRGLPTRPAVAAPVRGRAAPVERNGPKGRPELRCGGVALRLRLPAATDHGAGEPTRKPPMRCIRARFRLLARARERDYGGALP